MTVMIYQGPFNQGVFLHHRLNSILGGDDIKRFKLGASLVRFKPISRVRPLPPGDIKQRPPVVSNTKARWYQTKARWYQTKVSNKGLVVSSKAPLLGGIKPTAHTSDGYI